MIENGKLLNYIGGKWQRATGDSYLDVENPATTEIMVQVPLSTAADVDQAAQAAAQFPRLCPVVAIG